MQCFVAACMPWARMESGVKTSSSTTAIKLRSYCLKTLKQVGTYGFISVMRLMSSVVRVSKPRRAIHLAGVVSPKMRPGD
jgi:hypothetical protein